MLHSFILTWLSKGFYLALKNLFHWRCFGVFIVNFEHISQLALVFPLLTLNIYNFRLVHGSIIGIDHFSAA